MASGEPLAVRVLRIANNGRYLTVKVYASLPSMVAGMLADGTTFEPDPTMGSARAGSCVIFDARGQIVGAHMYLVRRDISAEIVAHEAVHVARGMGAGWGEAWDGEDLPYVVQYIVRRVLRAMKRAGFEVKL